MTPDTRTEAETQSARERIVVGIDGSEHSKLALTWAARLATALGSEIDAVMAWHIPATVSWGYTLPQWDPKTDAAKALMDTVNDVFPGGRPAGMRLLVRKGRAAKALLDASEDAAMLVVGSRGHGGFAGLLLGSVSAACAEHASCPVLVVHDGVQSDQATGEPPSARGRVVVGVDGSDQSRLALTWGARIAAATGAEIDAVAACQDPANPSLGYMIPEWDPQADAAKRLRDTVNDTFDADKPAGLRLVVRPGHPAKVLLEEGRDATMLVVGSRGYGGFAGLLLGSVSAVCAERSTCPVLIVHDGARA